MNRELVGTGMLATALLLSACTSETPDQNSGRPSAAASAEGQNSPFTFDPDSNGGVFAVNNCVESTGSQARVTDSEPNNVETDTSHVGAVETYDANGHPTNMKGATILGLGHYAYRIATSDDAPGQSTVVDVSQTPYSRVLHGEPGKYDVVFAARRVPEAGSVEFTVSCLANFGYYGNETTTPLEQLPTEPPATNTPAPAVPTTLPADNSVRV